jgi:hypothetical protein
MKKIIIGLVALVVIVGAGYYVYTKRTTNHTSSPKTTATTTNTTPSGSDQSSTSTTTDKPKVGTIDPAICSTTELTLHFPSQDGSAGFSDTDHPQGAAGTVYDSLILQNTGTRTCTLSGHAGISLINASGVQFGQPAKIPNEVVHPVSLAPQQAVVANVTLYTSDPAYHQGCQQTDQALTYKVYPPGNYGYLTIPSTVKMWCPSFSSMALSKY